MYVVKKPFNAGGKRWKIGEVVPEGAVRSASLIRGDYVAKIDSGLLDVAEAAVGVVETIEPEGQVNIPIITKDGCMGLSVAPAVISDAFRLIQSPAGEVIEEISGIESDDLLIILDACDSRKNVRNAVRKRAAELKEASETEENGSEGDG